MSDVLSNGLNVNVNIQPSNEPDAGNISITILPPQNGPQGETGATYTPTVDKNGILSWTNDKNLDNPAPVDLTGPTGEKGDKGETGATGPQGEKGEKGDTGIPGADGFSPTVTVTQTEYGATITATDKNGTTSAEIKNGKDGVDLPTALEIIEALVEADLLFAVTDKDGAILTDNNGILVM